MRRRPVGSRLAAEHRLTWPPERETWGVSRPLGHVPNSGTTHHVVPGARPGQGALHRRPAAQPALAASCERAELLPHIQRASVHVLDGACAPRLPAPDLQQQPDSKGAGWAPARSRHPGAPPDHAACRNWRLGRAMGRAAARPTAASPPAAAGGWPVTLPPSRRALPPARHPRPLPPCQQDTSTLGDGVETDKARAEARELQRMLDEVGARRRKGFRFPHGVGAAAAPAGSTCQACGPAACVPRAWDAAGRRRTSPPCRSSAACRPAPLIPAPPARNPLHPRPCPCLHPPRRAAAGEPEPGG